MDERLKVFEGSCEKDGEPDYELLRKHIEQWFQRYPQEAADFLELRKETLAEQSSDTGETKTGSMRLAAHIPQRLFALLSILSPNFVGHKEVTPKGAKKRLRTFLKKFPVFKVVEKL